MNSETQNPQNNLQPDEMKANRSQTIMNWLLTLVAIAAFSYWRPDLAKTVVIFVITLSILVFVHEWGHYQFGRWAGMKVNRFAIGFPPFIYTKRKNGIDYSIGALPIGGMVDIAGLGSESEMLHEADTKASPDGEKSAAPLKSYQQRDPNKPHGQKNFQDASLGWRFMTLFAGPMMNFIFALVVFSFVFSVIGFPIPKEETNKVDFTSPGMPAFKAKIHTGDRLVGVNGVRTNDPNKIRTMIRAGNGKPVTVLVERDGKILPLTITPQVEDELQADGVTTKKAAIIGVQFESIFEYKRIGFLRGETGFWDGAIGQGLLQSYIMADRLFHLLRRVVTLQLTPDDKRNIGGPVKIAQTIGHVANKSWQETILMAAALSVNLGLMNLLPIPALDGGRIMFLGYEFIARRPIDPRRETMVNAVGMAMVLCFMLFMTLRDVLPFLPGNL